jgi:hypothetical protein
MVYSKEEKTPLLFLIRNMGLGDWWSIIKGK